MSCSYNIIVNCPIIQFKSKNIIQWIYIGLFFIFNFKASSKLLVSLMCNWLGKPVLWKKISDRYLYLYFSAHSNHLSYFTTIIYSIWQENAPIIVPFLSPKNPIVKIHVQPIPTEVRWWRLILAIVINFIFNALVKCII